MTLRQFYLDTLGSITVIGLVTGIVVFFAWRSEMNVNRMTATTQARMIELQSNNHNTIRYEYFVSGNRYEGGQQGGSNFAVGSVYPVYYDPTNPSLSMIGDKPSDWFLRNLYQLVTLIVIFFFCFTVAYWLRCRQIKKT